MADIKTTLSIDVADGEAKLKSLGDSGAAALKQIDDQAKATTASLDQMVKRTSVAFDKGPSGSVDFDKLTQLHSEVFRKQTEEFAKHAAATTAGVTGAAEAGAGALGATEAIKAIQEAIHALHPALAEAGLGLGELGPVMEAARGGALALAAAIGGTLTVAFEKAGDAANDAAQRLGSFLPGGTGAGKQAFAGLEELSKTLNVSALGLAKPFEALIRAAPAGTPQQDLQKTLGAFVTSMQAERIPEADAMKAITEFWKSAGEKKYVDEGDFKRLREAAPDTADALLKGLQKQAPGAVAAGIIPTTEALQVAGGPEFAADATARKIKSGADAADSIGTAFDHLKASVDNMEKAISGGTSVVADAINALAGFFNKTAEKINQLSPAGKGLLEGGAAAGIVGGAIYGGTLGAPGGILGIGGGALLGALLGGLGGAGLGFGAGKGLDALTGGAGTPFPETLQPGFDLKSPQARKELDALAETIGKLGKTAGDATDDLGKIPKELGVIGAGLARQQAGLDLQFLPAEQASQLAHDKLNVERADIAVQQAQLGLDQAAKQQAIAGLSQRQADLGVDQARNQLDTIQASNLLRRLQQSGADVSTTSTDPNVDIARKRQQMAQDEARDLQEKQAETNLARAKIEQQYAYLQPALAKLAGEQAKINLKSAELEQSDSSLKLAKDEAGQPLARDLSALRYAQAQWDELKRISEYGKGTVDSLKTIIELLGGQKKAGEQKAGEQKAGEQQGKQLSPEEMQNLRDSFLKKSAEQQPEQQSAGQEAPAQLASAGESADAAKASFDGAAGAADQLTTALEAAAAAAQGGGGAVEVAGGGHVRGPGSTTSDSIVARLSDGEFVQSARAVGFWGTDFMHAINNAHRFNIGGFVPLRSPKLPAFAAGGLAGGGMSHLGTVDLRTDHGSVTMMASASAVTQLSRLAVTKRLTSTGRKPGFVS
jgi:hypothetical protein